MSRRFDMAARRVLKQLDWRYGDYMLVHDERYEAVGRQLEEIRHCIVRLQTEGVAGHPDLMLELVGLEKEWGAYRGEIKVHYMWHQFEGMPGPGMTRIRNFAATERRLYAYIAWAERLHLSLWAMVEAARVQMGGTTRAYRQKVEELLPVSAISTARHVLAFWVEIVRDQKIPKGGVTGRKLIATLPDGRQVDDWEFFGMLPSKELPSTTKIIQVIYDPNWQILTVVCKPIH